MFLFTNMPVSSASPKDVSIKDAPLSKAIRSASADTGVSFDYLMKTAKRESNLNSSAKAKTSSASGLYQFLDQTWLSTVKAEGARFGLEAEASQIVQGKNGRLNVPDASARTKILELRNDPVVSSRLAAAFTQQNHAQLSKNLGRVPSQGELYIAHFLGAAGAGELIRLAVQSPDESAAASFSDAASANKALFYGKSGEIKTIAEVYSALVAKHDEGAGFADGSGGADNLQDLQNTMYQAKSSAKPILGLFQGSETGPVSKPIQNAWGNMGRNSFSSGERQLTNLPSSSFFPASSGDVVQDAQVKLPLDMPMPPEKPADLVSKDLLNQKKQKLPLNLLSFIRQR